MSSSLQEWLLRYDWTGLLLNSLRRGSSPNPGVCSPCGVAEAKQPLGYVTDGSPAVVVSGRAGMDCSPSHKAW
jgi:hypothetical protein